MPPKRKSSDITPDEQPSQQEQVTSPVSEPGGSKKAKLSDEASSPRRVDVELQFDSSVYDQKRLKSLAGRERFDYDDVSENGYYYGSLQHCAGSPEFGAAFIQNIMLNVFTAGLNGDFDHDSPPGWTIFGDTLTLHYLLRDDKWDNEKDTVYFQKLGLDFAVAAQNFAWEEYAEKTNGFMKNRKDKIFTQIRVREPVYQVPAPEWVPVELPIVPESPDLRKLVLEIVWDPEAFDCSVIGPLVKSWEAETSDVSPLRAALEKPDKPELFIQGTLDRFETDGLHRCMEFYNILAKYEVLADPHVIRFYFKWDPKEDDPVPKHNAELIKDVDGLMEGLTTEIDETNDECPGFKKKMAVFSSATRDVTEDIVAKGLF